jgi:hypothetical protein
MNSVPPAQVTRAGAVVWAGGSVAGAVDATVDVGTGARVVGGGVVAVVLDGAC